MRIFSYVPAGYTGHLVNIEVDIRRGIPGTDIVGLAGSAVRESKERVRIAVRRSGYHYPRDRVVINLSPAGVPKSGTGMDLAIAIAILVATGEVRSDDDRPMLVIGELSLSGEVRAVSGALAAVSEATSVDIERFLVPAANAAEAAVVGSRGILAVTTMSEAVEAVRTGVSRVAAGIYHSREASRSAPQPELPDFRHFLGSPVLVRAMEIAAAGRHHLFLVGPPGSGKTLSARTYPSILPDLTASEAADVTRIHSLAGVLPPGCSLLTSQPFRSPHHSASTEGLKGGGVVPRPGELSLSHHGVLFLDEALQFRLPVLQSLRQPMETSQVVIARATGNYWFPSDFQLLLATNPCPCGNLGNPDRHCLCSRIEVARYWRRLGAPILDRIDIRVAVTPFGGSLVAAGEGESSELIRSRVVEAVDRQRARYRGLRFSRNARVPGSAISLLGRPTESAISALEQTVRLLRLSNRAQHAVLRVARTCADLERVTQIDAHHVLEAVQHRRLGEGIATPVDELEFRR